MKDEHSALLMGVYRDSEFERLREKLRKFDGKLVTIVIEHVGSGIHDENQSTTRNES